MPSRTTISAAATMDSLRTTLSGLLRPGLIGTYDGFEVVEVVATPRGGRPINVLSVVVACEAVGRAALAAGAVMLTPERIRIDGFRNWAFGVARTVRPLAALDVALQTYERTGTWAPSGTALGVGPLTPQPSVFVPPDGSVTVPLNGILKNNFWAGSHVLRLADLDKSPWEPFFVDRRRLQSLSDAVGAFVPLQLSELSDFLGDVVIQLPVTVLVPSIRSPRGSSEVVATVKWRSDIMPRAARVAARSRSDETLTGADVSEPFVGTTRLALNGHLRPVECEAWDNETGVLLAATASTSTVKRIQLAMNVLGHEPRSFRAPDERGSRTPVRIQLIETSRSLVGEPLGLDADHWRNRRNRLEEAERLRTSRDFVQYGSEGGGPDERRRALDDIRHLVDTHGGGGIDLWDPYLTADDLLQTLFACRYAGVRLRGMTDGRDPPADPGTLSPSRPSFVDRQRATFENDAGNREGLRLEFRTRTGKGGWAFHDRFLLFPGTDAGPSAWSLGTSVNGLGTAHHILQRVSNAALVAGAFEDLWRASDRPENLVWRSW